MSIFIVTTKRENGTWREVISSRAVATLEEAQSVARQSVPPEHYAGTVLDSIRNWTDHGGSVVLPDGTVIEVASVTREGLKLAARVIGGRIDALTEAELIVAYNAAQETP